MSAIFGVDAQTGKTNARYWQLMGWLGALGCVANIGIALAILVE